jgi:quercetin dioxygenase-like cupin family protein
MKVLRLYASESGVSCFDAAEIEMDMSAFAPPAPALYVSKPMLASQYVVLRLPVGWTGGRHQSPARQVLFCLSGEVRVTPGLGEPKIVAAGDVWLMEDTSGAGHETEVISQEPFDAVVVRLPIEIAPAAAPL